MHLSKSRSERVRDPAPPGGDQRSAFYLCGVDLSLDDVEDGDVAVAWLPLPPRGHHHVLGLQKPPHNIQHRGLPDTSNLKQGAVPYQAPF